MGMTDTEVSTYLNANHAILESIQKLLNQAREFDDLHGSEATYRDLRNISGQQSIVLRGEDLHTKIRSNYNEIADQSNIIVNLSQEFGLDASEFQETIADI